MNKIILTLTFTFLLTFFTFIGFAQHVGAFSGEVINEDDQFILELYSEDIGVEVNAVSVVLEVENAVFTDLILSEALIGPVQECEDLEGFYADDRVCFSAASVNNFDSNMLIARLAFEVENDLDNVLFIIDSESRYANPEEIIPIREGDFISYNVVEGVPIILPSTAGSSSDSIIGLSGSVAVLFVVLAILIIGYLFIKKSEIDKSSKKLFLGLVLALCILAVGFGYVSYADSTSGNNADISVTDTKVPKGSACQTDKDCQDSKCGPSGICGDVGATCAGSGEVTANEKCYKSRCSVTNGDVAGVCGGNGASCVKADGTRLNCFSGYCNDQGICEQPDKVAKGESCSSDRDCQDSKCSPDGICGGLGAACPASTQDIRDSQCYQSKCGGDLTCGGLGAICRGENPESKCLSGQCENDQCTISSACENDSECSGDRFCYEGLCYSKQSDGRNCRFNEQCESGICSETGKCLSEGTKKTIGEDCSNDDECQSGLCVNNVCDSITGGIEPQSCPNLDSTGLSSSEPDGRLTLGDFANFARDYGEICSNDFTGTSYEGCGSADTDDSNQIDLNDLSYFARHYGEDKTCIKESSD